MVLRASGLRYEKDKKQDKEPNTSVRLQLGEQKDETRVIRSAHDPVFNEYFEFFVKDLNRQRIDISVKGKDSFFSESVGSVQLPMINVAAGQFLQSWVKCRPMINVAAGQFLQSWVKCDLLP
ncbi:C2 domain-containing protein [Baffinella frigidus]|nr:C2 domain-containing protein [Cryptophyta sp. CCMP2293]